MYDNIDEFEQVMVGILLFTRNELIINKGTMNKYSDINRLIFKGIEQLIRPLVQSLNKDEWESLTNRTELTDNTDSFIELDSSSKCICGSTFKSTFPNVTYYCTFCVDDLTSWQTIIQSINLSIWFIAGSSAYRVHQSWFDRWVYQGI